MKLIKSYKQFESSIAKSVKNPELKKYGIIAKSIKPLTLQNGETIEINKVLKIDIIDSDPNRDDVLISVNDADYNFIGYVSTYNPKELFEY